VNLLGPVHHRSASAQADLAVVRSRDTLVAARTRLVNAVRGIVKATGHQLRRSATSAFAHKVLPLIPAELKPALLPLLRSIKALSEQIRRYDERIEQLTESKYPQTRLLQQVKGIGPLIALTYVGTVSAALSSRPHSSWDFSRRYHPVDPLRQQASRSRPGVCAGDRYRQDPVGDGNRFAACSRYD
jgi:transposase